MPPIPVDDHSTLFDFLPIGAYRSSPTGLQLRANPALVALNGYHTEAEQLAGVRDIATEWYVDPKRRAEFMGNLERDGFVTGFVSEVYRHKTRERIWISENAHAVRAADGSPMFYEGTVEEITARVAAEAALARSEAQLHELTRHLPGVVFRAEIDRDGERRLSFVSAGVQALYGIDAASVMVDREGLRRFIHAHDRSQVLADLDAATRASTPLVQEFRIVAADGQLKWVEMSSSSITTNAPEPVRCGVILDVTSRKLTEAALHESEARWKLALDSSGDGVWDWDLATGTETYSQRFKELFGYADHDLDDRQDAFDARTHPDDVAQMLRDRQTHFDGRAPRYANEHRVRCKDGSWKWVLSRGMVISRDADGRPMRMIGTHTDITARKEAEAMRLARDRAEAADRTKSEMMSRVSHELRTPLNAVLGFAQLLETAADISPRYRGWVQHILTSGRHLLNLVDDVHDVSSAQNGAISLAWTEVDPVAVVLESWTMLSAQAAQAGVQFDAAGMTANSPEWRVRADRRRLTQVMNNLLSNAIKYNRPGGTIAVQVARLSAQVQISVSDNGLGMNAQQLERMFTPFERLGAEHSAVQGTGLGLVLARQLVLALQGEIIVSSQAGRGTTFTVALRAAA